MTRLATDLPIQVRTTTGIHETRLHEVNQNGTGGAIRQIPALDKEKEFEITVEGAVCQVAVRHRQTPFIGFAVQEGAAALARAVALPTESTRQSIQIDCAELREQIRRIQNCRSMVFMATVGAVGATLIGTGGIIANRVSTVNDPTALICWAILGGLISFALLVIGILVTTEKARAINQRRGLLGELERALASDEIPGRYEGLSYLQSALSDCGTYQRAQLCPELNRAMESNGPPVDRGQISCWTLGVTDANPVCRAKKVLPSTLSSFTALSTTVYSLLYVVVVVLAAAALGYLLNDIYTFSATAILATYGVGSLVATLALFVPPLMIKLFKIKRLAVIAPIMLVIFFGILTVITMIARGTLAVPNEFIALYGSATGLAFSIWIGAYFLRQLEECRKGHHSVEAYRGGWHHTLCKCHIDFTPLSIGGTPG